MLTLLQPQHVQNLRRYGQGSRFAVLQIGKVEIFLAFGSVVLLIDDWMEIRHIFVTHKHIDHLLGIVWMVRMICQFMVHGEYLGEAFIYSHREGLELIRDMAEKLLQKKEAACLDTRLHLVEVSDGETREIIGHEVTFFDIQSTKARQFGFRMELAAGGSGASPQPGFCR